MTSVKYLGVKFGGNLSRKSLIDFLSVKLSRANALLFKIRDLESQLNYCSLALSQNCNAINQLVVLQKKLLEFLTFSHVTLTLVLYLKKFYSEILTYI